MLSFAGITMEMLAGLGTIHPGKPRSRQIYESIRSRIDGGELCPAPSSPPRSN